MKKAVIFLFVMMVCCSLFMTDAFSFRLGNKELVRLGVGSRSMFIVGTVYYASLWVPQELKGKSAAEIINADEPTAVIMAIDSKLITREKFVKAVREGFVKAAASGYATDKSDSFLNQFSSLEIAKGDNIYLYYTPGSGVSASFKSKATGQTKAMGTTPGLAFKKALFAIWLGPNPVQESLKRGMLGK
jgi:hypothetical protein